MAKIMVVEDDDYLREALRNFLSRKNHEVGEAPNGKVARGLIKLEKYDLILSDVQMPHCDGIELLKWVKEHHPSPFILMTGFTNLLETKTAHEQGADEFLAKPFQNDELIALIDKVLNIKKPSQTDHFQTIENQYCRVSIDEFVARPKIEFDVYVRLTESKYVKIGHAGDAIPVDRIRVYKEKGVSHLHIRREDFGRLVGFNLEVSKLLAKGGNIDDEKKLNFMRYTGEVLLEKAFIAGVDEDTYDEAKEYLSATVSIVSSSGEAFDLLSSLNSHSDHIYAHSVGVAMLALMIARKMDITTSATFFKLSMAGLFHDIGKKELPREILEKARPFLSQSERALLETHPTRSKEILSYIKNIPSDVIQMVYEHHEDCIGQGFPRRLTKLQLHPLSKILITANVFAEATIKSPHSRVMPAQQAIGHIETMYGGQLDLATVNALKEVFPAAPHIKQANG